MLKLSITGDTAKYFDFFSSAEVVHLYPHDSVSPLVPKYASVRWMGEDQDEAFGKWKPKPDTGPVPPTHLHLLVTAVQGSITYLAKTEPI